MSAPASQLPLPLGSAPRYGREDFLVGRTNEAALAYIERWPRWLAPAVLIVGPEGSGKSHLAAIFAAASGARLLRGDHLRRAEVPLQNLERALAIEDADRFPPEEAALFHLLNLARETGFFVAITARTGPENWGIATPDLLSRLRLQPRLDLGEPDEALLGALFVKLFADRQVKVEPGVVAYALARAERSCAAIQALVAELDRRSLIQKRPITRGLVAETLGDATGSDSDETMSPPQAD